MIIFYMIQMMITIMIHDYNNDCESGDPKMEYLDGGDDDYNFDSN